MFHATDFATAHPALALHIFAACLALLLGPFAIYRRKRDALHKSVGYVWIVAIVLTAASSFFLRASILPIALGFGAIHLLSLWALWTVIYGVRDAQMGRIASHQARMAGLYWQGLTLAGVLTLLPGRTLNGFFFADRPELGLWAIGGLGFGLTLFYLRGRLRASFGGLRRAGSGNP